LRLIGGTGVGNPFMGRGSLSREKAHWIPLRKKRSIAKKPPKRGEREKEGTLQKKKKAVPQPWGEKKKKSYGGSREGKEPELREKHSPVCRKKKREIGARKLGGADKAKIKKKVERKMEGSEAKTISSRGGSEKDRFVGGGMRNKKRRVRP